LNNAQMYVDLLWLRVQEEVSHPSKYATARLGYLRGADLSSAMRSGRAAGETEAKKSKSRRRSSLDASIRVTGGRRRSTLSGKSARRRSSMVPGGGRRGTVGEGKTKRPSLASGQKSPRGPGMAETLQVEV